MSKKRVRYVCRECSYDASKWFGRCPGCDAWNSFDEQKVMTRDSSGRRKARSLTGEETAPVPIGTVTADDAPRFSSGFAEMDRVLGSGWLPGALILMVGDPGVGKSSIMLQTSAKVAQQGGSVLYVTGEESVRQVRLRADRLGAVHDSILVMSETNLETIIEQVKKIKPTFLIVDSIQTLYRPDLESAPGSVSQVRECAAELMRWAKALGMASVLVGHVTKEGALAGPRVLEHIVDTVLYLEGDRHGQFRLLRAVKNRFGSTSEIGLFEMRQQGLIEVLDPSELFLSERAVSASGSVVVPTVEGTRPLLVEIQALVSNSPYVPPRRTSDGIDIRRVHWLLAVMEKRVGMPMGSADVYVKVAGGMAVSEPAIDLGLAVALASSFKDSPMPLKTVVFGEVGLAGEVRAVTQVEQRLREAKKMRFEQVIMPQGNLKEIPTPDGIEVVGVANVKEALAAVF